MLITEITRGGKSFVGYDYKTIVTDKDNASFYLDCYENFGWVADSSVGQESITGMVRLTLKRDRKIVNKMELTRLQRHFEDCLDKIRALELSKTQMPTIISIIVGLVGTAFLAGSVFAVTASPPIIWLCILLGIPGLAGWALPYFVFKRLVRKKADEFAPLIEQKRDEIDEICEKGHRLLYE